MSLVASALLLVFHVAYRIACIILAISRSFSSRASHVPLLLKQRHKTPTHVALILANYAPRDDTRHLRAVMVECTRRAVIWCRALGIERLSVYDSDGMLLRALDELRIALEPLENATLASRALERDDSIFPPTPPPSDHSSAPSRCLSPEPPFSNPANGIATLELRARMAPVSARRRTVLVPPPLLTLHVLSRDAGKPLLATLARTRAREQQPVELSPATLAKESEGIPDVDLAVVHPLGPPARSAHARPLELHGFPPIQLHLAEIYHNSPTPFSLREWARVVRGWPTEPISEAAFSAAMDDFARSEQRRGR